MMDIENKYLILRDRLRYNINLSGVYLTILLILVITCYYIDKTEGVIALNYLLWFVIGVMASSLLLYYG
jgi:hypothetical protein